MLCSNPQCSYTHWILHANYQLGHINNVHSKEKDNIFAKRHLIMSKILTEYKKKKPSSENILKPKPDVDTSYQTGVRKTKYHSQESILIPKDPTSPYAFTINANKMQKKKKYFFNQACCVVAWFLAVCLASILGLLLYLSLCTRAMTSGMT